MPTAINTDVLIVGAGVAGLWLNARLRRLGYSTVLVERASLGGEQTIKSQGIIHGGTKYALHGALTGASEAIADMPRRWREAINGSGELDLTGTRLLSDAHYLWSPGTLAGNLTSFFASKAVRGRVDQVKGEQLPPALQDRGFKGKVYRLAELVIDVPSLLANLAELAGDSLLAGERIEPLREGNSWLACASTAAKSAPSASSSAPALAPNSCCMPWAWSNPPCRPGRCTWSWPKGRTSSRFMRTAWAVGRSRV